MKPIKLFQIKAPHFVAGFCVDAKNLVWKTAPVIKWLEDKPLYFVKSYCQKKGWELISLGNVGESNDKPAKAAVPVQSVQLSENVDDDTGGAETGNSV